MSVLVIAEAGVNHNGSVDLALRLVDAAAEAGADIVKFQTFDAKRLVAARAPKAAYQTRNDAHDSQLAMLESLQLSERDHEKIVEHCRARSIRFMSTGFDEISLQFLTQRFDMPAVKIPSGEIVNARLLLQAARSGKPMLISTGMCTLADIERALGVVAWGLHHSHGGATRAEFERAYADETLRAALRGRVTLLHCTTQYPAAPETINLRAMDSLQAAFGLPVGYSDHSEGIAISIAAVARGAVAIEKHFTLDRSLPGPDHAASLLPRELADMIAGIRAVEGSLGSASKVPSPVELTNRIVARQSLVAARDIAIDEIFTEENLTTKRPGDGITPLAYWEYVGQKARRSYRRDEPIAP
jgi:N-acetylneuraminate synthase